MGFNYQWPNSEVMVGGLVVSDLSTTTSAGKRRRTSEPLNQVRTRDLEQGLQAIRQQDASFSEEVKRQNDKALDKLLRSADHREKIVEDLREEIQSSLNQAHDFRALLAQIRANVITILEIRFPGVNRAEAAEQLDNEGAIYFATELMMAKIDSTRYLLEPNLINSTARTFNLHSFILKYVRVYAAYAKQRDVKVALSGPSRGNVESNPQALSAVIHALLDNAVKYAPVDTKVTVSFDEHPDREVVHFSSLGPRIEPQERRMIFQVGFRAHAARVMESGGLGFGLASAQCVSDALNLSLEVQQSDTSDDRFPEMYSTTFTFSMGRVS